MTPPPPPPMSNRVKILGSYCENLQIWVKISKFGENLTFFDIFTKVGDFRENLQVWKSQNLKRSLFLLLKDWNNSFKWFLIFCRNKFQRFLKGNVSKISLKPNLEIFEKISLFKKSLKLVSMKYQISLKSLNQLLQSFNSQKVIF